jgi:hypothetical protein
MNLVELDRALRQLRLSGMAAVLDTRLRQAQTEQMAPIDLVSVLVASNSGGARTACSSAATSSRAFATQTARSIPLILISTRR